MRRIFLVLAGVIALGILASCASLSQSECEAGDWYSIGVSDGENGYPLSVFSDHIEACGEYSIVPDRAPYESGRTAGLGSYCTIRKAQEIGLAGRSYYDVCEGEIGLSFSRVYRQARDVNDVQDEIRSAEAEMDHLLDMLTDREQRSDDEIRQIRQSIQREQTRINLLEARRLREEAELREVVAEESARLARL